MVENQLAGHVMIALVSSGSAKARLLKIEAAEPLEENVGSANNPTPIMMFSIPEKFYPGR